MKPNHLLINEINYELRIRDIVTNRDIHDKRKILGKALQKEKHRNIKLVDPNFVYITERQEITNSLESIKQLVQEFEGPTTDSLYLRLQSRLIHVTNRIQRMVITEADGVAAELFKNESYATCLALEAELDDHVINQNPDAPMQNIAASAPNIITVPGASKNVDISKWNVKFDGAPDAFAVKIFLERVNELAEARQVSKLQLFESAVDLFTGDALLWLRQVKKSESIKDWDTLVNRLERDFLGKNYDDDLWDFIKARKQNNNESVIIFVAVMESLFDRLSNKPAEVTKIKWIRKNLRNEYVGRLALNDYQSVEQLVRDAKILEEVFREGLREEANNSGSNVRSSNLEFRQNATPSNSHMFYGRANGYSGSRNFRKNVDSSRGRPNFTHNSRTSNDFCNLDRVENSSKNIGELNAVKNISESNELPDRARASTSYSSEHHVSRTGVVSGQESKPRNNKSLICWNCGKPNHTFQSCKQKRNKFCFKCGNPGVVRARCKKCAGN